MGNTSGALAGRTAIVTGGRRGIGAAIVSAFSAASANVMTCGRGTRPDGMDDQIGWSIADVSNSDDCARLIAETEDCFGAPTILVNNAGIQIERTVPDTSDADWDLLMGANAKGVFNMCRAAIPIFAAQNGGSIINIGSISAFAADPSMALYNASKAFVHGLTRSIAVDHGPQGIRCNTICPGWIMTEMAEAGFALAGNPARAKEDALQRHPVRRFGKPEDIAKIAVWLATGEADFVTGQTLTADGGLTAASPLNPSLF
ncbi:SDR family NAD(P)-dependent oxidoreductase [Hwanghaeella sp.]|uniref:SDR family NAD(P)-dependent oxidoreductase n=1 Tax=Hwanghaeella sp. TaxID=2605943 RepID=UPI003CCBEDF7